MQLRNYARMDFTLDELGLRDPRDRERVRSSWDGLERFRRLQPHQHIASPVERFPPSEYYYRQQICGRGNLSDQGNRFPFDPIFV